MYLQQFLIVAGVHMLAVMSPGPDFIMIARNSLVYSRRTALFSAVGLGCGICVHVSAALIGAGALLATSVLAFNIVKYLGAAYIINLGIKCIRAKKAGNEDIEYASNEKVLSPAAAVRMGFFTNVGNPKAVLFFLALFTQVIDPVTPKLIQLGYGVEMVLATTAWFALVATVLSHQSIRAKFGKVQHWLERTFGVILVALGLRVAFSTQK